MKKNRLKKMFGLWFKMMMITFSAITLSYLISIPFEIKFTFFMYPIFFALVTFCCIMGVIIEKIVSKL